MDLGFIVPTTGMTMVMIMVAQTQAPQISGDWLVDVRTIAAVGTVVLLGTWRIGRWMRKIEDGQQQAKIDRESVYTQLTEDRREFRDAVREIFDRLNDLPCKNCPPSKHK